MAETVNREQYEELPWRVTIESPEGNVFKGSAYTLIEAFKDAQLQILYYNTPKKGRGMWEM